MNYSIKTVSTFELELKKLSKKYKNIKSDYKRLLEALSKSNPKDIAVYLGKDCYKMRLKNSNNNKGKSSGYRIIYLYVEDEQNISEQDIDKKILEAMDEMS